MTQVLPLAKSLFSGETPCTRGVGLSHLGQVLDDCHVSDAQVRYCMDMAMRDGCASCGKLAQKLLKLSVMQRYKLIVEMFSHAIDEVVERLS